MVSAFFHDLTGSEFQTELIVFPGSLFVASLRQQFAHFAQSAAFANGAEFDKL
jgi:hypothetical protein